VLRAPVERYRTMRSERQYEATAPF